ncbi:glucokinase [Micrococcales bacterium KH10]|nr:glucokinase [Micrococcales bacterium KH10]
MEKAVVGIDMGGTNLRAGIFADGRLLHTVTRPSTLTDAERQRPADAMRAVIADLTDATGIERIEGIGIAATGPVHRNTGIIDNPHTLPHWSGMAWSHDLAAQLGVPVVLENDAMGALLGEIAHGAGRGGDMVAMVTLGTGIGVAVHSRTSGPLRGADGCHPEGGHIPVVDRGPTCYCGLQGCWEAQCSGTAIGGLWTDDDGTIDWSGYAAVLARGLWSVIRSFGLDRVIIGGGVAQNFDDFIGEVNRVLAGPDPMGTPGGTTIVRAELDEPGMYGAAALLS